MTTNYHTPHAFGAPLSSAEVNAPLGTLDAALTSINGVHSNALDYGVVGDGVADDTAAIQNAIDACSASGGGGVLLPRGTYLCTQITVPTGVHLIGPIGRRAIIKANASLVQALIKFDAASTRNGIHHIKLDGSLTANASARLLYLDATTYTDIIDCWLNQSYGESIYLSGACDETRIIGNRFNNGNEDAIWTSTTSENTLIADNVIDSMAGHAWYIQGGWAICRGNRLFDNENGGKVEDTGHDVEVIGNQVLGSKADALNSFGRNVSFIGNRIVGTTAHPCRDTGICACGSGNQIVIGNSITGQWNAGINTGGAENVIIANNLCWANGRNPEAPRSNAGIRIRDTIATGNPSTRIAITGNVCWDDTTTYPLTDWTDFDEGYDDDPQSGTPVGQLYGIELYTLDGATLVDEIAILGNVLTGNLDGSGEDAINPIAGDFGPSVIIRGNVGYNPQSAAGHVSTPAFPATTVAVQNDTGSDVQAYIDWNGATVASVSLGRTSGGTTLGITNPTSVTIPAGSYFKASYTVATPTWKWFGL